MDPDEDTRLDSVYEAIAFRNLLMRMRYGRVTEEDWRLLLQHSPTSVDMVEFSAAITLYFDKKSVASNRMSDAYSYSVFFVCFEMTPVINGYVIYNAYVL